MVEEEKALRRQGFYPELGGPRGPLQTYRSPALVSVRSWRRQGFLEVKCKTHFLWEVQASHMGLLLYFH